MNILPNEMAARKRDDVVPQPKQRRQSCTFPRIGRCRDCGERFAADRRSREFCSAKCRSAFHNRAAARGADLFHLFMAFRFDRVNAKAAGVWSLMSRMAAAFKADDDRKRNGRPSWDDIAKVKARNVHLTATVVSVNVAGMRRRRDEQ